MTRLLHAAARGARIQALYDKWETDKCVTVLDLQDPRYDYRIHPDDEHLQYGPISSALRKAAENMPQWLQDVSPWVTTAVEEVANGELGYAWGVWQYKSELHRSLFLLILSEALADLGM